MCVEQIPNLDWPCDLYRAPAKKPASNGFREDIDATAEAENLTFGGKPAAIVRLRYDTEDKRSRDGD